MQLSEIARHAMARPDQKRRLTAPQPRLVRAAHEFEAQMMKELLKPMTDADGLDGRGRRLGFGSGGALGEFASEALGQALSEQGGFGIANGASCTSFPIPVTGFPNRAGNRKSARQYRDQQP